MCVVVVFTVSVCVRRAFRLRRCVGFVSVLRGCGVSYCAVVFVRVCCLSLYADLVSFICCLLSCASRHSCVSVYARNSECLVQLSTDFLTKPIEEPSHG